MQGLPFSSYLDPARASLESASVFAASWQFVCHVSDLPAAGIAVRFDCSGRSAVVLRTRAGQLQAYRNACRHRGARLVEGDPHTGLAFCVDGRLRCPYHGWTYDESGALASIPAGQRFEPAPDPAAHALIPVQVTQWRGLVFIAFELPRHPLAPLLDDVADAWPDLAALRRVIEPRTTECRADWKLAAEHMLDTAHLAVARPALKPRLFDAPVYARREGNALRSTTAIAAGRAGEHWSARIYRELLSSRTTLATPRADYLYLWPNLLLELAPDGLSVLQVLPDRTGACRYRELRYAVPDPSREMRLLRYLHHRVRRQALAADVRLLDRVQQGMETLGDDAGGVIADNEPGLQWFVARCRQHLPPTSSGTHAVAARARKRTRKLPETES